MDAQNVHTVRANKEVHGHLVRLNDRGLFVLKNEYKPNLDRIDKVGARGLKLSKYDSIQRIGDKYIITVKNTGRYELDKKMMNTLRQLVGESVMKEAKYKTKDKYKKGDKVVYQLDYGASPMLAKSKAEKSKEKVGRITKATKDSITGKPKYVIDGISVYYTNILGLAENKQQGESKMKITKTELVEMIQEVIKEENEYQKFFKEKLGGRNLGDMSDEEKKAFFADVDKEWKAKNETLEPVSPAQGNPLKSVKAKKATRILAAEEKVEQRVREIIREELTFLMFGDKDGSAGHKVQKRKKRMGVSA